MGMGEGGTNMNEQSSKLPEQLSSEERTHTFFQQDVEELALSLQGRIITVEHSNKGIRLDTVEAFRKERIGADYKRGKDGISMDNISPGILWIFYKPLRKMRQSLIAALDQGQQGACVRIVRASKYDETTDTFIPMEREGDIANYFGFNNNDLLVICFLDDTETLFLEKMSPAQVINESSTLSSGEADRLLEEWFRE